MGLLSAGVAIGVAHLVAGFIAREASPVVAVGSAFIDLTPEWLKSFAIRTFGESDKLVLLAGIDVKRVTSCWPGARGAAGST